MPIQHTENASYLGDGVYVDINECGSIILTTEDGYSATNTIYFEPKVTMALIQYIKRQTHLMDEYISTRNF